MASDDPIELAAAAKALTEALDASDIPTAEKAAQCLLSSGQILAAEAFLLRKYGEPLSITNRLATALDQDALVWDVDTRYLIARTLRLFAELTLLRSLQKDSALPHAKADDLVNASKSSLLRRLISHANSQNHPGLEFELQCAKQAVLRWRTDRRSLLERHGEEMTGLIVEAAAGDLNAVTSGVKLIAKLSKEMSKSWYDECWPISWLGMHACRNQAVFDEVQGYIKQAYDRRDSELDEKILFCACDLLADLTWRGGDLNIVRSALQGQLSNQSPGLAAFAGLLPKSSYLTDRGIDKLHLWRVRHLALCHLSALREHPSPAVRAEVDEILNDRRRFESNPNLLNVPYRMLRDKSKTAYCSLFFTDEPCLWSCGSSLEQQEQSLQQQRIEQDVRMQELSRREESLQLREEELADIAENRRLLEEEKERTAALIHQLDQQRQDLLRLQLDMCSGQEQHQREIGQDLQAFLFELERKLTSKESAWPCAHTATDRDIPLPLKGLYAGFQLRHQNNPDVIRGLTHYIPLSTTKGHITSATAAIEVEVEAFLQSNDPLFLLRGDAGCGKSLYAHLLERHFWHNISIGFVPLLIELKSVKTESRDLIGETLANLGYNPVQIDSLKGYPFLFLLDGYDELHPDLGKAGLKSILPFSAWPKAKVLVTCRNQSPGVEEGYWKHHFTLPIRNEFSIGSGKRERFIAPISSEDARNYAESRGRLDGYQRVLKRFPELRQLVTNPLLMRMVLEVVPDLEAKKGRLTAQEVIATFVEHWFEQELARLSEQKADLPPEAITRFADDAQELAAWMWKEKRLVVRAEWRGFVSRFRSDADSSMIYAQEACPLRLIADSSYTFIHKCFWEYFVAEYTWEMLLKAPYEIQAMAMFDRLFPEEPAILDFLARKWDRVESSRRKPLRKLLNGWIRGDKPTVAANAITLLNWFRVPLSGRDLTDIQVPGANLEGALCHYTNFAGANLQDVRFNRAQLSGANFSWADLQGASFGQWPMFVDSYRIDCIAYNPDGSGVAFPTVDGIEIWDPLKSERLQTIKVAACGQTLAFSPSGEAIVSGWRSGTAIVWYPSLEKESKVLRGHHNWLAGAAFSPDEKRVVTAGWDYKLCIWDVATGEKIQSFEGHPGTPRSVAFRPDGAAILTASYRNTAYIWDVTTGKEIEILGGSSGAPDYSWDPRKCYSNGHRAAVTSAEYSPSGERIVTASDDHTARIWDAHTAKVIQILKGHTDCVIRARFSPSGEMVVTTSWDCTARIWDVESGSEVRTFRGHTAPVRDAAFHPNERVLVTAGRDRTVRVWEMPSLQAAQTAKGHTSTISSLDVSPDGKIVVTSSRDKTVRFCDAASGTPITSISSDCGFYCAVFSPEGGMLFTADSDKNAFIWDLSSKREPNELQGYVGHILRAAFSPDEKTLATVSPWPGLTIWDVASGSEIRVIEQLGDFPSGIKYSPGGELVLAASENKAHIWSVGGEEIACFQHKQLVTSSQFSRDGKAILTTSRDRTAAIWDATTGRPIQCFEHPYPVTDAAYAPDDRAIVTAGEDKAARIWCLESGGCLQVLYGHTEEISSVVWSTRNEIVTASDDCTVALWRWCPTYQGTQWCIAWRSDTTELIAKACQLDGVKISAQNSQLLSQLRSDDPKLWSFTDRTLMRCRALRSPFDHPRARPLPKLFSKTFVAQD